MEITVPPDPDQTNRVLFGGDILNVNGGGSADLTTINDGGLIVFDGGAAVKAAASPFAHSSTIHWPISESGNTKPGPCSYGQQQVRFNLLRGISRPFN